MLPRWVILLVAALLPVLAVARPAPTEPAVTTPLIYPPTKTSDAVDVLHGVKVPDPYRWLEDEKSPEVKKWMAEEDKQARDYLGRLPGRDKLSKRLKEL